MKRRLYYIAPFIAFIGISLVSEYLIDFHKVNINVYVYIAMLLIVSALIGMLSPTAKVFDLIITIISPLSFCSVVFLSQLLKSGCSGKIELFFGDAFEAAFQPLSLIVYCIMALLTFIASYKPLRLLSLIKKH